MVLCAVTAFANGVKHTPPSAVNQAETCQAGASQVRVTVQVAGVPVVDAIDYLFCGTGYKYTIEPGIAGRVSLNIVDMPLDEAICKLATSAGLGYIFDGKRYIFIPCPRKMELPCPPCGAGAGTTEAQKQPNNAPEMQPQMPNMTAPPMTGPPMAPPRQMPSGPVTQGPIFYGNYSPRIYEAPPPSYGGCGGWGCGGPFLIVGGPAYPLGAPLVLPPPYLRPPSLQRMLAQMYALYSTPGYPTTYIGGYSGRLNADPWFDYGYGY